MAEAVKPLPLKVAVAGKVTPDEKKEIMRLARRLGIGHSSFVARVLSALVKKNVMCPACGVEHAIHPESHGRH